MSEEREELGHLVRSVRRLVALDADDDAAGYSSSGVQASRRPGVQEAATAAPVVPAASQEDRPTLEAIRAELGDCRRCKLCDLGRSSIVFGEGSPAARLVFVGEGPGFHEDRLGRPFVGAAGELLDKMIGAMTLRREDVYICNVVKCRPPENRDPEPDEVLACQPFLQAQLRALRPDVVVAMGRFAAQTLLKTVEPIGRLRGRFHPYNDTKLMPTYHPAYLLRTPGDKKKAWEDLQLVMAELGLVASR